MKKDISELWIKNVKDKVSKKVDHIALANIFKIAQDLTNKEIKNENR